MDPSATIFPGIAMFRIGGNLPARGAVPGGCCHRG